MAFRSTIISILLLGLLAHLADAQELDFDSLLIREVQVENPTYMPVVGVSAGTMHFFGDVRNSYPTPYSNKYGVRFNVSTPPFDKQRTFLVNFFLQLGQVTGNERSVTDLDRNLNFNSSITAFGVNLEYDFGHFYREKEPIIQPYLSAGFSPFLFSAKGDLLRDNIAYNYWSDGTIRDLPEAMGRSRLSNVLTRDWDYETDLREADLWGQGRYSQFSFAIPLDLGVKFNISDRVKMKMGGSFFFTFTDMIDDIGTSAMGVETNGSNDHFAYTYLSLHLDLFSPPDVITEELLFAELDDFDYTLFEDEDNDGVVDGSDECFGTPPGVEVDSLGCPLDYDSDGVPDYLDREDSSPGAIVDEQGVEYTEEALLRLLAQKEAIPRSELGLYFFTDQEPRMTIDQLDQKFHALDENGDQYLDFDELLKSIDDFFDYQSFMEDTDEVYKVINFFFKQ